MYILYDNVMYVSEHIIVYIHIYVKSQSQMLKKESTEFSLKNNSKFNKVKSLFFKKYVYTRLIIP